jgi:hypothetical protein
MVARGRVQSLQGLTTVRRIPDRHVVEKATQRNFLNSEKRFFNASSSCCSADKFSQLVAHN